MEDREMIAHALRMWANYIETGSVLRSAADSEQINDGVDRPRALSLEQHEMVIRLHKLASKSIKGEQL